MLKIIDTFDEIQKLYECFLGKNDNEKLDCWLMYIDKYPELKEKVIADYASDGYDWVDIAINMSFPLLESKLDKICEAHDNIMLNTNTIGEKIETTFGLEEDIDIILYYGLCNSAGWATSYNEKAAVLLGIEKIVELNWQKDKSIKHLICHELCHVAHSVLRSNECLDKAFDSLGDEAAWRLYIEGFAQRYEQVLLDDEHYNQDKDNWLNWCKEKHRYICSKYLDCIMNELSVKDFYGDWNSFEDRSDVGYYLGCEFIRKLQSSFDVSKIAKLDIKEVKQLAIEYLKEGKTHG